MMTTHTIELIDRLISEHHSGNEWTAELQQYANDAVLLKELDEAQESFMPGRLDQKEGLKRLDSLMQEIKEFLHKHFNHEETVLLEAVEELNDLELLNAFHLLLNEHSYLKTRLERVQELIDDLKTGNLNRQHWDSSANDLKAYLNHTRKLMAVHAASETTLFIELRRHLIDRLTQGEQSS